MATYNVTKPFHLSEMTNHSAPTKRHLMIKNRIKIQVILGSNINEFSNLEMF